MGSKMKRSAEPPIPNLNHAQNLTWLEDARCRNSDPTLFFPETPGDHSTHVNNVTKTYCHNCPVIEQCYEYGVAIGATAGIFGGIEFLTPKQEKDRIRRRHRAGHRHA